MALILCISCPLILMPGMLVLSVMAKRQGGSQSLQQNLGHIQGMGRRANSSEGSEVGTCANAPTPNPLQWHEWVYLGLECDYDIVEYDILRRRHPPNVGDKLVAQRPQKGEEGGQWIAKGEIAEVSDTEVVTYPLKDTAYILKSPRGTTERFLGEEALKDDFIFVPNTTEAEELRRAKELSFLKGCEFSSDLSRKPGVGLRGDGLVSEGRGAICIDWEHVNGVCARAIINELAWWYKDHGRKWNLVAGAMSSALFASRYKSATCQNSFAKRSRSTVLSYDTVGIRVCWDFVIDFHSLYCDAVQYSQKTSAAYRDICKISASNWAGLPIDVMRRKLTDLSVRGGDTFTKEEAKKFIPLREDSDCDLPETSDGLVLTDLDVKKQSHTLMKGFEERAVWLYLKPLGPSFMYSKSRDRIDSLRELKVCNMTGFTTEGNQKLVINMKPGIGHEQYIFKFLKDGSAARWNVAMSCLLQKHC